MATKTPLFMRLVTLHLVAVYNMHPHIVVRAKSASVFQSGLQKPCIDLLLQISLVVIDSFAVFAFDVAVTRNKVTRLHQLLDPTRAAFFFFLRIEQYVTLGRYTSYFVQR